MSEKIILSVEQDEAVKFCLEKFEGDKEKIITLHANDDDWGYEFDLLNTISLSRMARILFEPGSYEVEKPEYETGDIVVGLETGRVYKIISVKGPGHYVTTRLVGNNEGLVKNTHIRHATTLEIIFAESGREVGVFVDGDVGLDMDGSVWKQPYNIREMYEKGNLKGFYPESSYIKLP